MVQLSDARGVLSGNSWLGQEVTFAFADGPEIFPNNYSGFNEPNNGFSPLNETFRATVRSALEEIASLVAIDIPEVDAEDADIVIGQSTAFSTAWAYGPEGNVSATGDVWFNPTYFRLNPVRTPNDAYIGHYAWATVLHELGHSFGLKHGHSRVNGIDPLPSNLDGLEYSLMTYRSYVGDLTVGSYNVEVWGFPQSFQMLDIAALQSLYGANYEFRNTATTYRFDLDTGEMFVDGEGQGTPGENRIFRTLWDGGGTDHIDLSNYETDIAADLRPGEWIDLDDGGFGQRAKLGPSAWSPFHIAMSLSPDGRDDHLIEDLTTGSGDDVLVGNDADNVLSGGLGLDVMRGNDGADLFRGSLAGLDGDIIEDFSPGDVIELTDLDWASASFRYVSGQTLLINDEVTITLEGLNGAESFGAARVGDGVQISLNPQPTILLGPEPERYVASSGPSGDVVAGGGNDVIVGGPNGGFLLGGSGSDVVFGGAGDDFILPGPGNDLLRGGGGFDTYQFFASEMVGFEVDTIEDFDVAEDLILISGFAPFTASAITQSGADSIVALGPTVFLSIKNTDAATLGPRIQAADLEPITLFGPDALRTLSDAAERLIAQESAPLLVEAAGGDDFVLTGSQSDEIFGGAGSDVLLGAGGGDILQGDAGNDLLEGGGGADTFVFVKGEEGNIFAVDTILDFTLGTDVLRFDGYSGAEQANFTVTEGVNGAVLQLETNRFLSLEGILGDVSVGDLLTA